MAGWSGHRQIPASLRNRKVQGAAILLFLEAVWVFIQSLPLPFSWLAYWSPKAFEFYSQAYKAISLPLANTGALSLDSGTSLAFGFLALAYACFFLLMLLLINSRRRLYIFCMAIVLSGVFQAVFGGFMTLSGMEYLLFMKKQTYVGFATGTFVNRNHLAGYLEMSLAIGIGLLVMTKNRIQDAQIGRGKVLLSMLLSEKAVLRLMLVIMVIGLILTRSRMGNAAFFSSLILTGLIAVLFSRHFRSLSFYVLLGSMVLIDVYLLGSWFGLDQVVQRLEETSMQSEDRDEINAYILPLIADFWLTGAGAGTFFRVFPGYLQENVFVLYDHAHDDYLELLGNLGVIGFCLLALFVILSFYQALIALGNEYPHQRAMGFAACMGSLSILLHSFVDFNLQIPANAMLYVALLALPYVARHIKRVTV